MKNLRVDIEIRGVQTYVGNIIGNDFRDAHFRYAEEYLQTPGSVPVSISLPLQKEIFSVKQTRNFFEGLLPEGFTRRSVAQWMRASEEDYLSILAGLGKECLGALRITDENDEAIESAYEKLSMEQVRALAREGAVKSAQLVTESHLSLTGASGKVGLYYDKEHNEWFLPKGDAPSTHIVKQSHVRLDGIVINEQLALLTAAGLGMDVPESFIINVGDYSDEKVLFAIKRYDRIYGAGIKTISGRRVPIRLHQEDFAQALGIAAADKYEKNQEGYLKAMFDLLRYVSENPVSDQLKLWDMIIFDYLIGNTDNHIKNFSLLYRDDLKGIRLAPAYDIVSTTVYEGSSRDMAFHIGGEYRIDRITRDSFGNAAKEVGLGQKLAMTRFDEMCSRFEAALSEAAGMLTGIGSQKAAQFQEKILHTGGYGKVICQGKVLDK